MMNDKGYYEMHEKFNLCILMNMTDDMMDDEIVQMLLDQIPNIKAFKKVFILPEK